MPLFRFAAVLAAVLAVTTLSAPGANAATKCERIKADFFAKVKPAMASAVTRAPSVAIGFNNRLSIVKRGSDPTLAEINRAYRLLLKDCRTKSDRADCNSAAKRLRAAAVGMFRQHQKWARAKCRGRLTVR